MAEQSLYSLLDRPEIIDFMFYPRREWTLPPQGARDHIIEVDSRVSLVCRFYPVGPDKIRTPSILFFHGNGEVAADYDMFAPFYNQEGINLFVADYRGYGRSGGTPAFSTMFQDAHTILHAFRDLLAAEGYTGKLFVMGRSLGALSAVELASHYRRELAGFVIESGSAGVRGWSRFIGPQQDTARWEELHRVHVQKLRSIELPLLSIHGEMDELVPLTHAIDLHDIVASKQKELVLIPGAGHNDIFFVGQEQYMAAVHDFIFGAQPAARTLSLYRYRPFGN